MFEFDLTTNQYPDFFTEAYICIQPEPEPEVSTFRMYFPETTPTLFQLQEAILHYVDMSDIHLELHHVLDVFRCNELIINGQHIANNYDREDTLLSTLQAHLVNSPLIHLIKLDLISQLIFLHSTKETIDRRISCLLARRDTMLPLVQKYINLFPSNAGADISSIVIQTNADGSFDIKSKDLLKYWDLTKEEKPTLWQGVHFQHIKFTPCFPNERSDNHVNRIRIPSPILRAQFPVQSVSLQVVEAKYYIMNEAEATIFSELEFKKLNLQDIPGDIRRDFVTISASEANENVFQLSSALEILRVQLSIGLQQGAQYAKKLGFLPSTLPGSPVTTPRTTPFSSPDRGGFITAQCSPTRPFKHQ